MKKIMLFMVCLIILTGCNSKENDIVKKEKFLMGHTLEDGRSIHFAFDPQYNNSNISVALANNDITIYDFIENLNYIDTYNDGGSKIYEYNLEKNIYGKEHFYVVSCNSLDNIKDIYVAKYKESLSGVCTRHIDEIDEVNMTIKKGSLTNTGATVLITDKGKRENIYGDSYKIEKLENGTWVELKSKNDMVFNSIGYTVNENYTLEFDIDWEYFYGKLNNGTYRILKDFSEAGEGVRHYVSVQFKID